MGAAALVLQFARRVASGRLALTLTLAVAAVLVGASASEAQGPLTLRREVPLGFRAHDIILEGSLAYVATERGLTILDISDPLQPVVRSSERSPYRSQGLAKKGAYIYLAIGRGGIQVIDVSNPDDPVTVAKASKAGTVYDVAVHPTGDAAYAITYNGELYVWNIANPRAPVLTQTLGIRPWRLVCGPCLEAMRNHTANGSAQTVGVSTAGNTVGAVDWAYGGFYLWDSTDPLHLTFRGTHRAPVGFRAEVDLARDVVYVLGTYAWLSGVYTVPLSMLTNGVATYPADPPGLPWPAGTDFCTNAEGCDFMPSSVTPYGGGINFSGKYVFYAAPRGNGELGVVDATNPGNLVKVGSAPLGVTGIATAQGTGVVSRGDVIYVAAGMRGIQVWEFPGLSTP